jgi:hypothetical protein
VYVCLEVQTCEAGACTCPSEVPDECAGECIDTDVDERFCGNCSTTCHALDECVDGACTCVPQTVSVTLGPETKNALLDSKVDFMDTNRPDFGGFHATTWTTGGNEHSYRTLTSFDLPELPPGSSLLPVTLTLSPQLYKDTFLGTGHNPYLGKSNAAHLLPVTQAWDETTVTWNNQPATTLTDAPMLAMSTSFDQVYEVDVTSWAGKVYAGTLTNYGFKLQLVTEEHWTTLYFVSGDVDPLEVADPPVLKVTYTCP